VTVQRQHDIFHTIAIKTRGRKLSAGQGNEDGRCFELGIGIGINASEAARFFKFSADDDSPLGVMKPADCLEYGKGVRADACEAARYHQKFVEGADHMNELYHNGLCSGMG
jgi:TPR repeat protein